MNPLELWQFLQVNQDLATAELEQALAQYGISAREFMLLRVLSLQNDDEGGHFRMKDLAQRVGLSASASTRLVNRLEDRGLLTRYLCPTDRRGIYTDVTEEGAVLVEKAVKHLDQVMRDMVNRQGENSASLAETQLKSYMDSIATIDPLAPPVVHQ